MINVFEPTLTFSDKFAVLKSLIKKDISGTSPIVQKFENETAKVFDRKYAVSVSNGSAALDIALQLLNLEEGDEVIVPSFTIISCLSAILRTGATPVFCDVDTNSWNMDIDEVEKNFTSKTKAVLMVHLYGLVADASKIMKFCQEKDIMLIEDAAEAHGQIEGNKKCGSFGEISTMSFYANKHITTGEGGMILTDSENFYKRAKQMINLDFNNQERFKHDNLFWNYRLGGLQASLGLSQIKNLNKTIENKINQGKFYSELLQGFEGIVQYPLTVKNEVKNHYWVYGVVIKNGAKRESVMQTLELSGIQTRPFFWPLHLQNCLPDEFKLRQIELPNSEFLGNNGFYIPIGDHVSKKDQKYIIEKLVEALNANQRS